MQEIDPERNLLLKHPFTMLVAGSTGSGKTWLVREILSNYDKISCLNRSIRVLWCYGIHQKAYDEDLATDTATVQYNEGVPDSAESYDVIVMDDLQAKAGNDERVSDLFTRYSHHRNVSVILILQNIFHQAKMMRTVSLNSHYLILLSSRRDQSQVRRLGSQLYPGAGPFFHSAYKSALSRDYGYLLIDLTPTTEEKYRLRTNILPLQYPIIIFQPKDGLV